MSLHPEVNMTSKRFSSVFHENNRKDLDRYSVQSHSTKCPIGDNRTYIFFNANVNLFFYHFSCVKILPMNMNENHSYFLTDDVWWYLHIIFVMVKRK